MMCFVQAVARCMLKFDNKAIRILFGGFQQRHSDEVNVYSNFSELSDECASCVFNFFSVLVTGWDPFVKR